MARIRTHPGEVPREEFMKPLGLSANALALAPRVHGETAGRDGRYSDPARALFRYHPGILARPNTPSPSPLARDGGEVEIGTAIERDVQPRAGLAA